MKRHSNLMEKMKDFDTNNNDHTSNFNANGYESEPDSTEIHSKGSERPTCSAMAAYFSEKYVGRLLWNTTSESWFEYNDEIGVWTEMKSVSVQRLIQIELKTHPQTCYGYSISYIDGILKILRLSLHIDEWNTKPNLLPLQNGVLNLATKELLDHSPDYRFSWCLPYDYDPTATCEPVKDWLLETTLGDEQIVQLLRAYMNAVIKGRSDLQRFLECIGEGSTGKSTFANLVIALVGIPNTLSTSLKTLETNRFESANLLGKRLVYIADSERYTKNASKLKALTGQDQIRYERKYAQGGDCFCFEGMLLIVANETIQFNDHTGGVRRRRITVPFNNRVKPEDRRNLITVSSTGISGDFANSLPGLLNWVLEMSDDEVTELLQNTDRSVPSLAATTAETLTETNPMAGWLDECLVIDPDAKTYVGNKDQPSSTHLYPNYVSYCTANGHKAVSSTRFSRLLLGLLQTELNLTDAQKDKDRKGVFISCLRFRVNDEDAPRPITGVMDDSGSGDGSQDAETPMGHDFEGCDESEQIPF